MAQFKMACYGFVTLFILAASGCAPSTASKPEGTSTSKSSTPGGSGGESQGEGQRGGTREGNTPGTSSLDQLREGKPPITPGSSPLKDVFFDFDRYDLRGDARETLKVNADWLKKNPSARVEIEGHCDERGTNEYNLALGAKRAQASKDYLVTLGISGERLSTISYGSEIPVCKEHEENCWRQNRRDRFVIIPSKPAS
ncbi:MAG TPA: peptidoglycan-associated lipoprotein Pal [Methylomirabilota bacterium]|nr:peptidoglycan-associated lipoprotein Pal [Methylomirabilota bacterium]